MHPSFNATVVVDCMTRRGDDAIYFCVSEKGGGFGVTSLQVVRDVPQQVGAQPQPVLLAVVGADVGDPLAARSRRSAIPWSHRGGDEGTIPGSPACRRRRSDRRLFTPASRLRTAAPWCQPCASRPRLRASLKGFPRDRAFFACDRAGATARAEQQQAPEARRRRGGGPVSHPQQQARGARGHGCH